MLSITGDRKVFSQNIEYAYTFTQASGIKAFYRLHNSTYLLSALLVSGFFSDHFI